MLHFGSKSKMRNIWSLNWPRKIIMHWLMCLFPYLIKLLCMLKVRELYMWLDFRILMMEKNCLEKIVMNSKRKKKRCKKNKKNKVWKNRKLSLSNLCQCLLNYQNSLRLTIKRYLKLPLRLVLLKWQICWMNKMNKTKKMILTLMKK